MKSSIKNTFFHAKTKNLAKIWYMYKLQTCFKGCLHSNG